MINSSNVQALEAGFTPASQADSRLPRLLAKRLPT